MDWIEDKRSRISQVNMVSKFPKLETIPKMATSASTFKKLPFLALYELNPAINFIVIFYKRKCIFAKFGYFWVPVCGCSKVTLKFPILVTLCCQKLLELVTFRLPEVVTLSTAISFKNCQKWKLLYARSCQNW